MILDLICLAALLLALWKGLKKGLIVAVFSVVGFLLGLLAAMKFSAVVAAWMKDAVTISEKWLPVLAFVLVFAAVMVLVRIGSGMLEGMVEFAMLGWLNKLGGVLLYLLLYVLVVSVLLFYAEQLQLVSTKIRSESVMYSWLQPVAPAFLNAVGILLPVFKNLLQELEGFFQQIEGKINS